MTLEDLKLEVQKYQYIEDTNIIDVTLASIIATRLKLGDPIWLIIIGASSGGKSQILRPMSLTDGKFMHRVDDLTDNTFLSGAPMGKGEPSLLLRIGPSGMLVVSDLTVIFSKNAEVMNAILSQFRMIYDGQMTKYVGTKPEPLEWKGSLGILAGSTPSIYANFERVADMGERFIYYRMKDYDEVKATRLALDRKVFGKELDNVLGALYEEYLKDIVANANVSFTISEAVKERIIRVSTLAEKIRTAVSMDWKGEKIARIPVPAFPMRIAQQLIAVARGLYVMRGRELDEKDMEILDWCCFSLANEEKRACIKVICSIPKGVTIGTSLVADRIGLDTAVVRNVLQNLSAVGVLERTGTGEGLQWRIKKDEDYILLRQINGIKVDTDAKSREISHEEKEEHDEVLNHALENFGKD
jgi:hypothetical protein